MSVTHHADDIYQRKRKGFTDSAGNDIFASMSEERKKIRVTQDAAVDERKKTQFEMITKSIIDTNNTDVVNPDKAWVGAQPVFLKEPQIASTTSTVRVTSVACRTIRDLIKKAEKILIVCAEDSKGSPYSQKLFDMSCDDEAAISSSPVTVAMGADWLHTLPHTQKFEAPSFSKGTILVYVGTPSKHLAMSIGSDRGLFEAAYGANQLVVLCKGACMLPIGGHEENFFGIDEDTVLEAIWSEVQARCVPGWGHGCGTKQNILQRAYGYIGGGAMPEALECKAASSHLLEFEYLTEYIGFLNEVKMAKPSMPVKNFYDSGLMTSVMTGYVAQSNMSLLLDRDGLSIMKDGSPGHVVSKLNQLVTVEPYNKEQAVYNFFIGDGACRLNGGVENTFHLIQGYSAQSLVTFFIFNNKARALQDQLIGSNYHHHSLYNMTFYDLLCEHGNVATCESEAELREALEFLSRRTLSYIKGETKPGISMLVLRNITVDLPPIVGNMDMIRKSPEIEFMRNVLGTFAAGCQMKIPIFGCSSGEFIQFLKVFRDDFPEGQKYQYICGRTDIQAAHMCGYRQPEGKCVLFINDVAGINSIGESMRMILSGFEQKKVLVMIWHPILHKVMDHFNFYRPPMVWPNMGPQVLSYFVRKSSDAEFIDFHGGGASDLSAQKATAAIASGKPLIAVNMMPEQERDFTELDVRIRAHTESADAQAALRKREHLGPKVR